MKYLDYVNSTWEEFRDAINDDNSLILMNIGCLEEHGPHLPINTDGIIGHEICKVVARNDDIILGPNIVFGTSRSTQGFPGTIEIRISTLRALVYDVVYSFASQGVKNVVLFNWHGGSSHGIIVKEACNDVLEKLREENNLPQFMSLAQFDSLPHLYVFSSVQLFEGGIQDEILSILDTMPHHAAELETSMMMHLSPKLVKKDLLVDLQEFPDIPEGRVYMRGNQWLKKGLMGDASSATEEKGKKIFEIFTKALSERIQKILKAEL